MPGMPVTSTDIKTCGSSPVKASARAAAVANSSAAAVGLPLASSASPRAFAGPGWSGSRALARLAAAWMRPRALADGPVLRAPSAVPKWASAPAPILVACSWFASLSFPPAGTAIV